jgi:hypothetical protein
LWTWTGSKRDNGAWVSEERRRRGPALTRQQQQQHLPFFHNTNHYNVVSTVSTPAMAMEDVLPAILVIGVVWLVIRWLTGSSE